MSQHLEKSEIVPLTDFAMNKNRAPAAGVRGVVAEMKVFT